MFSKLAIHENATIRYAMYAIVEISGKQYKVEEGRYVDVDLQGAEPGAKLNFDQVLMIANGKDIKVGQPTVAGASIAATLLKNDKEKKIIVYKMKPKKGTRKKQGHRQQYSRLMIDKIAA